MTGLLVFLACLLPQLALAASLTIGPSDALSAAVAQLQPGDTLFLRGGTYDQPLRSGDVMFPSGTSWANPITIASAPGETATFTNTINIQANSDGSPVQFLILDRLAMHVPPVADSLAVRFGEGAQHMRVSNSDLSGGGGVWIVQTTDDVQLVGNRIHDIPVIYVPAYGTSVGGYGVYGNGQHMLIDGNTFQDIAGYALHLYLSGGSVDNAVVQNKNLTNTAYSDGARNYAINTTILAGSNNVFQHNVVTGNPTNHGGAAVSVSVGRGNQILGNTITGNGGPPVEVNESAVETHVLGNTMDGSIQNDGAPGLVLDDGPAPEAVPRPSPAQGPPTPQDLHAQRSTAPALFFVWTFPRAIGATQFLLTSTYNNVTTEQLTVTPSTAAACTDLGGSDPDTYCVQWPDCPVPGIYKVTVTAQYPGVEGQEVVTSPASNQAVCVIVKTGTCTCEALQTGMPGEGPQMPEAQGASSMPPSPAPSSPLAAVSTPPAMPTFPPLLKTAAT